jgi:hypothetical protein
LRTEIEVERHVPEIRKREARGAVNRLAFFALLIAVFGLTSCHHSSAASTAVTCTTSSGSSSSNSTITCTDPVTNITLSLMPGTISLNVTTKQTFTYSISGGTNNQVIFKVNDVLHGNPLVGTIDSSGNYIAPQAVPSTNPVSVTVTSFEDQKLTITAMVKILPAPVVTITSPTSPPTVTSGAAAANQITFSATETGGTTNSVFWEVGFPNQTGVSPGNDMLGMIDANGVYTPPRTPPIGSTVVVTAVAQDFPSSVAQMTVTILRYSTSSLGGQFAFSMAGHILSGPSTGAFFRAGNFVADGNGGLSGTEDINDASGVTTITFGGGKYTVMTSDGRGTLQFNDGRSPASFNFVLVDGKNLQIMGFDATGTASGQATAQVLSAFAGDPLSALTGTYVFDFSGFHGANALSEVGEFNVSVNHAITGGSISLNDGGTATAYQIIGNQPLCNHSPPANPSTYTVSSTGVGTLTLNTFDSSCNAGPTLNYSFYAISKGGAKFVSTDTIRTVAGFTLVQAAGVTFNNAYLSGNYAFLLENSTGTYASAGSFSANGQGTITTAVLDENLNGTPNPNVVLSGGAYQVASNGSGTLSFSGGRTYVFFLGPVGTAIFQETDAGHASDGMFSFQQNNPFAVSQIAGNYAIATSGLSSGTTAETLTGEFGADGKGGVTSGAVDVNAGGMTNSGVAVTTGSYSTSSSAERGTLALTLASPLSSTRNYAAYVVSSTQVFVMGIDSGRLAAGQLLRQF